MPAPAPMQMTPLQFATSPSYTQAAQGLSQGLQQGVKSALPTQPAAPVAPPLSGAAGTGLPGNPYAGPVNPNLGASPTPQQPAAQPTPQQPGPSVTDIIRNMTPPQIANWLQNTSTPNIARTILPQGMQGSQPGSSALFGAGMLPAAGMGSTFGG